MSLQAAMVGAPDSKAVTRKVTGNPDLSHNLSYPVGQHSVRQRAVILEQE